MSHDQGTVAKRIGIKLQAGEPACVAPQAAGYEVQRVFEVAVLRLKMMRTQIHAFRPDGLGEHPHSDPPDWACGSRITSSICGLAMSAGTCAAKLRARVTVS